MSVHLPKKKIELKTESNPAKQQENIKKAPLGEKEKSGDAALVYKDKNHRVKKELSFRTPKNNKGMA